MTKKRAKIFFYSVNCTLLLPHKNLIPHFVKLMVDRRKKFKIKNKNKSTMTTTTPLRKKRAYRKKSLLTQDELWKVIIPNLWVPFIHFCLEDWVEKIDFTRKPDFLDKELKRLLPRGKSKNRAVDILMRVYLKDGTTQSFLLHIEVQGYFDPNFAQRVFQYYYRISDLFQEPIETLVIMIDEDPNYRPNAYQQVFGQTALNFAFRMFKLLDNPPPYFGKEDNPFSVVFEVAWYALKQNRLKNDDDLKALKFSLIKRLLENRIERTIIYDLLDFINIYLPFQNSEKGITFEQEIDLFIDKEEKMGTTTIRELYIQKVEERERKMDLKLQKSEKRGNEAEYLRQEEAKLRQEEAKLRQEEAKLRQEEAEKHAEKLRTIVLRMHNHGSSIETIADIVAEPIAKIQSIIDKQNN
jgi:hypothetical protein